MPPSQGDGLNYFGPSTSLLPMDLPSQGDGLNYFGPSTSLLPMDLGGAFAATGVPCAWSEDGMEIEVTRAP